MTHFASFAISPACCSNEGNAIALQPRFSMNQLYPHPVKPSYGISSYIPCEEDDEHLAARKQAVLTVGVTYYGFQSQSDRRLMNLLLASLECIYIQI